MNALQRDLKKLVPLVESLGAEKAAAGPHRQRIPQQGRPADCEIEEKEGKKFQVKNSVDGDQRTETG